MTPIEGTSGPTPEPSPDRLAWAVTVTAFVSIVAVVVLSLTHNADAATLVAGIGMAVTGVQFNARNRR